MVLEQEQETGGECDWLKVALAFVIVPFHFDPTNREYPVQGRPGSELTSWTLDQILAGCQYQIALSTEMTGLNK